jgi:beta-glucosidase
MISGGGSAQVDPAGGMAPRWQAVVWFPDSPLKSIANKAPGAKVSFAGSDDVAAAAALAKQSDVAIVFVYQWSTEGMDLKNLTLPENQDALVAAVAAANPHTIVVLETGTVVTMPWADSVSGILSTWYSGSKGSDAIANVLFGDVNPSGKLPITFPKSEADLPHPVLQTPPPSAQRAASRPSQEREVQAKPTFSMSYTENQNIGYKWYDSQKKDVLFPFGFGLSYTTYAYSDLQVAGGASPSATFTVKNTGARAGAEVAEVYAALPAAAGEAPKRLVGFSKVWLKAGESQKVTVAIDPKYLSVWDESAAAWKLTPGAYSLMVGGSSQSLPLKKDVNF